MLECFLASVPEDLVSLTVLFLVCFVHVQSDTHTLMLLLDDAVDEAA